MKLASIRISARRMRPFILSGLTAVITACVSLPLSIHAQPATAAAGLPAAAVSPVPRLVRFHGTLTDSAGYPLTAPISVTFSIYSQPSGDQRALWHEVQQVTPDSKGDYTVLLGAASPDGLPEKIFGTGDAQYLSVKPEGAPELTRVLLVSVPYALKAGDAQTLAGLPASAFALAGSPNAITSFGASSPNAAPTTTNSNVTTTGGTSNYIPVFKSPTTLMNSEIFDTGKSVGIGDIPNPSARLDINGAVIMRGNMIVSRSGNATTAKGYPSYGFDFFTSVWNSSTNAPDNDYFSLQSEPVGNNTPRPSATFNLIYAKNGAAKETGFSINTDGTLNFAHGQTFPGAVSSIGLQMPAEFSVTGSTLVNNGNITVQWVNAPTPFNSINTIVERDGGGYIGVGGVSATGDVSSSSVTTNTVSTNALTVFANSFLSSAYIAGPVSVGTTTPVNGTELNLNQNNTASTDIFLIGNNTTKGLQMRDNGSAVDLESIAVPLYVNFTTKQPIFLNPNGGGVIVQSADSGLGFGSDHGGGIPALAVGANIVNGQFYSAYFSNDVTVDGNFAVRGTKNFHIDHPLDPEHKTLDHAAIESNEVLNQYNGNATLDSSGEATINLPDYFEALNVDFRYQLTAIGAPGPNLYIAQEVSNNSFRIAGGSPGLKVSWQVTARRNDKYMQEHPFVAERNKQPKIAQQ